MALCRTVSTGIIECQVLLQEERLSQVSHFQGHIPAPYIHPIQYITDKNGGNNRNNMIAYIEMHTKLLYSVAKVKKVSTDDVVPDEQPELPWFEYGGVRSLRVRHR